MGINFQRRNYPLRIHFVAYLLLVLLLLFPQSSLAFLPCVAGGKHSHPCSPCLHGSASGTTSSSRRNDDPTPGRYPKTRQIRQKPRQQRRPRNYWTDIDNIRQELEDLWSWANVTRSSSHQGPPPIPNETLLSYWKRHDLRAAIATHGGRDLLAESLGGALVIPGKWQLAVQTPIVQQLLAQDPQLIADAPPLSPQQQTRKGSGNVVTKKTKQPMESPHHIRWQHSSDRKAPGYWSSQAKVIEELYHFLQQRSHHENIPEAWMPRLSDITSNGRDDLALAIRRFGGPKAICRKAGLVPFREWNYIEGMYELFLQLREYLDQHHAGDYTVFPVASHVKQKGYDRLYSLIQYYGGVKFLSARLDMDTTWGAKKRRNTMDRNQLLAADMSWGPFDLEFGLELYAFVREQQALQKPPLKYPEIRIPSQLTLLKHGSLGLRLDKKIQEYGGYENVARRLGLGFSFQSFE